jgi:hypothetical protein
MPTFPATAMASVSASRRQEARLSRLSEEAEKAVMARR